MSEVREGYKMTELGEIPVEWEVKSISDVFKLYGCMSLSRAKTGDGDTFYLHYGDIHKSKKNIFDTTKDFEWIPKINSNEVKLKAEAILETGDVVFADASEDYADIAKNVVVKVGMEDRYVAGLHTIVIREKSKPLDFHFKAYVFKTHEVRKQMQVLASGSTVLGISKPNLGKLKFILPPFEEQQKIASILSTVGEQIVETNKLIVKTKELKNGLMQQLLTKGIGHTEFKNTEYGEIPVDWEIKALSEVCLQIQDGNHGEKHPKASDYVKKEFGETVPFVMASDITTGKLDYDGCKYIARDLAKSLRVGHAFSYDVLLSHKATIGKVAIVPAETPYIMLTPQVTSYKVNEKLLTSMYLKYYMESSYFQQKLQVMSAQSTRSYIGISKQKELLCLLPSLEEQQKISSIILTVDEEIEAYEEEKAKYEELKKGLMQKLLTGQIRVKI